VGRGQEVIERNIWSAVQ